MLDRTTWEGCVRACPDVAPEVLANRLDDLMTHVRAIRARLTQ